MLDHTRELEIVPTNEIREGVVIGDEGDGADVTQRILDLGIECDKAAGVCRRILLVCGGMRGIRSRERSCNLAHAAHCELWVEPDVRVGQASVAALVNQFALQAVT